MRKFAKRNKRHISEVFRRFKQFRVQPYVKAMSYTHDGIRFTLDVEKFGDCQ